MSKFDPNFSDIFGILGKTLGGGPTAKRKITKPAHFVFQSYWVVPSTWQSFIENGEMACVTSAWSSRKLGLNKRKQCNKCVILTHSVLPISRAKKTSNDNHVKRYH